MNNKRREQELILAFYMGALKDDIDFLSAIPLMSDEELDRAISNKGELFDWE